MNNKQRYDEAFMGSLAVEAAALGDGLEYNSVAEWDSIGHMGLIASLEEAFSITIETDDIVDFGSYRRGFEILEKYGVTFGEE